MFRTGILSRVIPCDPWDKLQVLHDILLEMQIEDRCIDALNKLFVYDYGSVYGQIREVKAALNPMSQDV